MKSDEITNLVKKYNGYLSIFGAQKLGISKTYIQEYIEKNKLEKVAHGLYKTQEAWYDELYILSFRNKKMIYSFDTALMLHGLTEKEPSSIYITVPRSYNASHLRSKSIEVYQIKKEWVDLGKMTIKIIYGNEVVVYDMERTICDILRVKNKKDLQTFIYAIKEYTKRSDKNLLKLSKYAKEFNVEEKLRLYMEVLL